MRRESYLDASLHPDREAFVAQLLTNLGLARLGIRSGALGSQQELVSSFVGRVPFFVAAQSPVPEEVAIDPPVVAVCGNNYCDPGETCTGCAVDCAVCDVPPPWELPPPPPGTDGGLALDAMTVLDAGTGDGSGSGSGSGSGLGSGSGSGFGSGSGSAF